MPPPLGSQVQTVAVSEVAILTADRGLGDHREESRISGNAFAIADRIEATL